MKIGKLTIKINISWEKSYMSEIKQYLREGRKFMAFKTYREATNKSVQESKNFIDELCPEYLDANWITSKDKNNK
jgi:ribosomal protein L7/L12